MTMRLTTGARNAILDGTAGWRPMFAGGKLDIYTGSQPATPDLAPSGTLLASITLPSPCFAAASSGAIAKTGTWQDSSANASGTAGWARFKASGDDDSEDDAKVRMDVDVGEGAGELQIDNEDINAGQSVTVTAFTITQPAS